MDIGSIDSNINNIREKIKTITLEEYLLNGYIAEKKNSKQLKIA